MNKSCSIPEQIIALEKKKGRKEEKKRRSVPLASYDPADAREAGIERVLDETFYVGSRKMFTDFKLHPSWPIKTNGNTCSQTVLTADRFGECFSSAR